MEQAVEGMERRAQEERGRGGGEGEGGDNTGTGEGGEGKPCRPEVIGQMFVDDSMWFAKGAVGMQRMVNMHETFCTFHGLQLNKEKCEHMAMNAPAYNLQWAGEQAKLQAAVARGDSAQVLEELKGKVQVATKRGDDRHMKYLGVTFEARKGWARQRGKMDTDFKTMRDRLMSVAITTQQAVYSVNSVVIPKLMYPQQVAIVPRGTLKRWDTELRGVVAKAGKLPRAMPVHIYYLPVEVGGLGLRSLEDEADIGRIVGFMEAINDVDQGRATEGGGGSGDEWVSTQGKVVDASIRRNRAMHDRVLFETGTQAEELKAATKRMGVRARYTLPEQVWSEVLRGDKAHARAVGKMGEGIVAYTDGGLDPGVEPRAGWGMTTQCQAEGWEVRGQGRLHGEQSNSIAEAMALLQVLRGVHPTQDVTVYIDNNGVLQNWDRGRGDDPRGRLQQGGRAVWNRILGMKRYRADQGGATTLVWVHSHVDDKDRRERKPKKGEGKGDTPPMQCACGGNEKGHCIPEHHAHVGNELADSLAEGGKHMKQGHLLVREATFKGQGQWVDREKGQGKVQTLGKGGSQQLHRLAGEERVVLRKNRDDNQAYQGGIRKALKQVCQERRFRGLEEGGSKRGRAWEKAREKGEGGIRRKLCKQRDGSDRFRVRAWADVLPTYEGIAKKAGSGGVNPYREVYGEGFTGECQCCGAGQVEDSAHVFQHCTGGQEGRDRMVRAVDYLWKEAGLGRAWDLFRWVQQEGGGAWGNTQSGKSGGDTWAMSHGKE